MHHFGPDVYVARCNWETAAEWQADYNVCNSKDLRLDRYVSPCVSQPSFGGKLTFYGTKG